MTQFFTKLASAITALALVASFMPTTLFAQEAGEGEPAPETVAGLETTTETSSDITTEGFQNSSVSDDKDFDLAVVSNYSIIAPSAVTIQKSSLISETSGVADVPADVSAIASSGNSIEITLVGDGTGDQGYSNVRISPTVVTGGAGTVQLWIKEDSSGKWYNTAVTGWGPGSGFPISANYNEGVTVVAVSDVAGTYNLAYSVVNVANGNAVVASGSTTLTVEEPTSAIVNDEVELKAALANTNISAITFGGDITITSAAVINRQVSIDGAGHTLTGSFAKTTTSNNSVVMINNPATGVTITNLVVDGGGAGNNLHGINVWQADGITLTDIVAKNSNSGINVNDSSVTVNNVTTLNNRWGGINVDKGDASLVVNGTSSHGDAAGTPAIWKDDNLSAVSISGALAQYTASVEPVNATTGTLYYLSTVKNEVEFAAALANNKIPTITLGASFPVSSEVKVNRTVTIEGNGKTLTASGTSTNYSVILITGADVTIKNLTVEGKAGVHGIQAYVTTGVNLTDVTLKNNGKSGLVVNGSTVTVTNLTTSGNGWNGVNVDQGGNVITPATLTVNGTSSHDEIDAIWIDNIAKTDVSVVDTNNQYVSSERAYVKNLVNYTGRVYVLAPEETNSSSGRSGGSRRVTTTTTGTIDGGTTGGQVLGASTYNFTMDLTIGSRGADVSALQQMLIDAGLLAIPAPTGYFGELTRAALAKWQAAHGVAPAAGYFGPITRAAILAAAPTMSAEQRAALIADLLKQVAELQAKLAEMMEDEA